ncbi:hypothetical protein QW060_27535 [Myroides ceti]|uniref:Uncharacterized protein n=1 Tax=Paenimyroides ceti TaxID=395087 RepID=A0ABT8D542_9FLAO|nr:hypothetical protein [Paenimyroides ceti]MDN3710545.1 hypothetical protein [Paenimyroides ceti]
MYMKDKGRPDLIDGFTPNNVSLSHGEPFGERNPVMKLSEIR